MELYSFLTMVLGENEWPVSDPITFNRIEIKQKAGWPPEPVWVLWRSICHPFCKQDHNFPAVQPAAQSLYRLAVTARSHTYTRVVRKISLNYV